MTITTRECNVTQCQIYDYQETGAQFMHDVFGMDYERVVITDMSDLSDFTYSGMPPGSLDTTRPLKELVAIWDNWAIARVQELYGITLTTTVVNLICLFNQIELSKKALIH